MVVTGFQPAGVAQLDDVLQGVLACNSCSKNLFPLHSAAGDGVSSHFKTASEHRDIGGAHRVPVRTQTLSGVLQVGKYAASMPDNS